MEHQTISSFDAFWPVYVRAHTDPRNRALHFVGTTIGVAGVTAGLLTKKRWLLLAGPAVGYGLAFAGHWLFEKNDPLTFRHPLYSLRADLKMWVLTITGAVDDEIARVVGAPDTEERPTPGKSAADGAPEAPSPSSSSTPLL